MAKFKYKTDDGSLLAAGFVNSFNPVAGEAELEIDTKIPSNLNYYLMEDNSIVRRTDEEVARIEAETNFSDVALTAEIGKIVAGQRAIELAQYLGPIQSYAAAKNFKDLRAFVDGLFALKLITSPEILDIYESVSKQGVNLGDY